MSALAFAITDARPAAQTASPGVVFRLQIDNPGPRVHALLLRCQTRIEVRARRYAPDEQPRLYELFGDPAQWDRTLHAVTWAHTSLAVPSFDQHIVVDLPVACTYDLEVAAAKYFHAIRDGDVPLDFLFSGSMFRADGGRLQVEPVSWACEASFRMPARVWHATMEQFFPGGGWIRLQRDTLDRLQAYRGRNAAVTWDEALDRLLDGAAAEEPV
jgi:hypothetical protein